jgi:hypothetical protein
MLDLTPATFEEFESEASLGNVVPVVRTVLADMHTPVGAFMRIAGDASHAFLLESIEGGERVARYSFLGANPWMIARGQGRQTIVEKDGVRESHNQNAVEFLREYLPGKNLRGVAAWRRWRAEPSVTWLMTGRVGSSRCSKLTAPCPENPTMQCGCSFAPSSLLIACDSRWKSLQWCQLRMPAAIAIVCALCISAPLLKPKILRTV